MDESTDPEANAAELPGEPTEASEVEELVDEEGAAEQSPEDDNVTTDDEQVEMDKADETDVHEEEEKEGAEEHDTLQEETDDQKEPTETEQVDTEEKLEEELKQGEETTEELEATDGSEDVKEHTDETLPKESEEAPSEVPVEEKHEEVAHEAVQHGHKEKKRKLEKKESISYNVAPRFEEEMDDAPRTSGDFLVMGANIAAPVKFYKYIEEGEEEEEEHEIELEVEDAYSNIDRGPYYEKHITLTKLIEAEKIENNVLQKKLATFFKKRRMEHVLKETDQKVDTQQKYSKKLDAYAELMEIDSRQRKTITEELQNLKVTRETKFYQLQKQFEKLQEREKEVGTGLINSTTGNVIPDKVVERLIRLQKSDMEQVSEMRLKFIKLKYLLAEKQEAITIIDKIGEDLYLMDFEQLKVENRGLADKIEERDEELTKLRGKCQDTIQILAHMREKTAALESDIDDLKDDLQVVGTQSVQIREQLNTLKQERDYYRNMCNKLHNDSGLLTEVELLRDMEDSMADLQTLTEDLENMKAENRIKAQQIRNIRKHIEYTTEGMAKRIYKPIPEKSLAQPHFYKGRPSIFTPTLPKDAFRHLKHFQSKSTIGKNKKKLNNTIE